jgi:hypothetical protein
MIWLNDLMIETQSYSFNFSCGLQIGLKLKGLWFINSYLICIKICLFIILVKN